MCEWVGTNDVLGTGEKDFKFVRDVGTGGVSCGTAFGGFCV
jgi:hypothetical protein